MLCGAFARGALRRNPTAEQADAIAAMVKLVEVGWGQENPAFVQLFTSQFFPGATPEQMNSFNDIQRHSAPPRAAAKIVSAFTQLDASRYLSEVQAPTLVFHSRDDGRIPFEEGRYIAATIPHARFEPLDTGNHVPLEGEPAFKHLFDAIASFLPGPAAGGAFDEVPMLSKTLKWSVISLLIVGSIHFVAEAIAPGLREVFVPLSSRRYCSCSASGLATRWCSSAGTTVMSRLAGVILGVLPAVLDVVGFGMILGRGLEYGMLAGTLGFGMILFDSLVGGGFALSK